MRNFFYLVLVEFLLLVQCLEDESSGKHGLVLGLSAILGDDCTCMH